MTLIISDYYSIPDEEPEEPFEDYYGEFEEETDFDYYYNMEDDFFFDDDNEREYYWDEMSYYRERTDRWS